MQGMGQPSPKNVLGVAGDLKKKISALHKHCWLAKKNKYHYNGKNGEILWFLAYERRLLAPDAKELPVSQSSQDFLITECDCFTFEKSHKHWFDLQVVKRYQRHGFAS